MDGCNFRKNSTQSLLLYYFTILLILLQLIYSSENDDKSVKNCSKIFPSFGKWYNFAPFWISDNCLNTNSFNSNQTQECMQGRTLYVIGNSVPRQFAFGLMEMLGGSEVKREQQRDLCPKLAVVWGDSCHQEFKSVKFRYLYLIFFDGLNYTTRGGFQFSHNVTNSTTTNNKIINKFCDRYS